MMKKVTSFIFAVIMAFSILAYSSVGMAEMNDLHSVSSSDVEYVLECCDNFQQSIQEDSSSIRATLTPEEFSGP